MNHKPLIMAEREELIFRDEDIIDMSSVPTEYINSSLARLHQRKIGHPIRKNKKTKTKMAKASRKINRK